MMGKKYVKVMHMIIIMIHVHVYVHVTLVRYDEKSYELNDFYRI